MKSEESNQSSTASESDASVGYQNPPVKHQFQKGCSGNPRGRPRRNPDAAGAKPIKNAEILMLEEAYRMVSVKEGNKIMRMPAIQAVMRGLGVAGMKGNRQSQLAFKAQTDAIEAKNRQEAQDLFEAMVDYKIRLGEVFRKCDQMKQPRPEPVPHPDDIQIDVNAGKAHFVGPKDPQHKAAACRSPARSGRSGEPSRPECSDSPA